MLVCFSAGSRTRFYCLGRVSPPPVYLGVTCLACAPLRLLPSLCGCMCKPHHPVVEHVVSLVRASSAQSWLRRAYRVHCLWGWVRMGCWLLLCILSFLLDGVKDVPLPAQGMAEKKGRVA